MKLSVSCVLKALLIGVVVGFSACATVPKEVVELSYVVGQDLVSVHVSYQDLIHRYFDGLRLRATDFLEKEWTPTFLQDFIERGELVTKAQGSDPKQVLEDVQDWTEVAMEQIEQTRKELIDPIDKDEQALLSSVDEAFSELIRANATITAHLNSIRKVQQVQDDALAAMNLKDLRDRINDSLISASQQSEQAIKKMKQAEHVIEGSGKNIKQSDDRKK